MDADPSGSKGRRKKKPPDKRGPPEKKKVCSVDGGGGLCEGVNEPIAIKTQPPGSRAYRPGTGEQKGQGSLGPSGQIDVGFCPGGWV